MTHTCQPLNVNEKYIKITLPPDGAMPEIWRTKLPNA